MVIAARPADIIIRRVKLTENQNDEKMPKHCDNYDKSNNNHGNDDNTSYGQTNTAERNLANKMRTHDCRQKCGRDRDNTIAEDRRSKWRRGRGGRGRGRGRQGRGRRGGRGRRSSSSSSRKSGSR